MTFLLDRIDAEVAKDLKTEPATKATPVTQNFETLVNCNLNCAACTVSGRGKGLGQVKIWVGPRFFPLTISTPFKRAAR